MNTSITAVVLTWNEEKNIRTCLESVASFCPIHVVDSGSTDRTVEICRHYTPHIVEHPYENHARQWQWALDNLPIETDWILALDADFVVTKRLRQELARRLPELSEDVHGIYVRHHYVFGGGPIRFGGTKQYWLRVVRRGLARADTSDMVDFRFIVPGRTVRMSAAVVENNRYDEDISTWLQKQDKFSIRLAVEEELRRGRQLHWQRRPALFGNPDERIMWLRDRWLQLPLFTRPVIYLFYRYVLMLGFLDGRAGFLYHVLQGFWLRLVVDWKIVQLRRLGLDQDELNNFARVMLSMREGSVARIHAHMLAEQHPDRQTP